MSVWLGIWLFVVLKLPVAFGAWVLWRAIKDVPDQVIGSDGGGGATYRPGPRLRGPHGGLQLPEPPAHRRGASPREPHRVARGTVGHRHRV